MAAKKQNAMDFIVSRLKKNPGIEYAKLKTAADEKNLVIYPIMFGRAQHMLGLTKPKKTKRKKAASKKPARSTQKSKAPGRGRSRSGGSKSARIRELLGSGMSTAQIAKRVGCSTNLVYVVKSHSGRKPSATPRPKTGAVNIDVDTIVRSLKELQDERDRLRATLEKIDRLLVG